MKEPKVPAVLFQPPSRVDSLEQRIRDGDRFPKIEEAQAVMKAQKEAKEKARLIGSTGKKKSKTQMMVDAAKAEVAEQMAGSSTKLSYFNSFRVNDDPEVSKDILYDEIIYPKLFNDNEEVPPDAINKLWMAGFLDRAVRDQKALENISPPKILLDRYKGQKKRAKEEKKAAKKKSSQNQKEYVNSILAKRRPSELDDVESIIVQTTNANFKKSKRFENEKKARLKEEALKKAVEEKLAAASAKEKVENENTKLGSPRINTPDAFNRSDDGNRELLDRYDGTTAPVAGAVVLSAEQEMQLKLLENKALGLNDDGSDPLMSSGARKARMMAGNKKDLFQPVEEEKKKPSRTKRLKKLLHNKIQVYQAENKKLKLLLKPPPKIDPTAEFFSRELEFFFEIERVEDEAARVIQRAYRNLAKLRPLKYAVYVAFQVRKIQKVIRGWCTRKWLGAWYFKRFNLTIQWQANFRRWRSNKYWGIQSSLELRSVTLIQRRFRGWLGRARFREKQWGIAAVRIQCMWRGITARARCDKMWLDGIVIPIQVLMRKYIAKTFVNNMNADLDDAALKIQQRFRMSRAEDKMGKTLYKREMNYREDVISMIVAEEEWAAEQLVKMAGRMGKSTLKEELEQEATTMHDQFDEIYDIENEYMETQRQREILSPRAIAQGWVVELDKKIVSLRDQITNYKLDSLFHKCLKVSILENKLELKVREVEEMAAVRMKWADFRKMENADRVEREYVNSVANFRKDRKQKIADEKRKWQVRYSTPDGKPDKKRRPGRPWDPSVLAKPDHMTHTPLVDLTAEVRANDTVLKPGSDESVERSLQRAALQQYLDQVNTYEQMLMPIQNILSTTFGGAPNHKTPEQHGFGSIGAAMPTALADIGATPQLWNQSTNAKERIRNNVAAAVARARAVKERVDMIQSRGKTPGKESTAIGDDSMQTSPARSNMPDFDQYHDDASVLSYVDGSSTGAGAGDAMYEQPSLADMSSVTLPPNMTIPMAMGPSGMAGQLPPLDDVDDISIGSLASEVSRQNRKFEEDQRNAFNARKKERRANRRPKPVSIPWKLLDELEGERRRFDREKMRVEVREKALLDKRMKRLIGKG